MKCLLKLIAQLYPSAWRSRYGVEYEALLEDKPPCIRDAFDVLTGALKMQMATWSFTRITVAASLAGILAALAISFAVPAHYDSKTLVTVGPGLDAAGHPVGTLARNDFDAALLGVNKDVLSSESLGPIIQRLDLYPRERASMSLDMKINQMRRNISMRALSPGPNSPKGRIGFILDFSYPDPQVAQQVDAELASLFMGANLLSREGSGSAGQPRPSMVFAVQSPPTLPLKPSFPNRSVFGAGGLLAGLTGGLVLASIIRLRHKTVATNG